MVGLLNVKLNESKTGVHCTIEVNTSSDRREYWFDLSFDKYEYGFYDFLDIIGVYGLDELTNVFCNIEVRKNPEGPKYFVMRNFHNLSRSFVWEHGFEEKITPKNQ